MEIVLGIISFFSITLLFGLVTPAVWRGKVLSLFPLGIFLAAIFLPSEGQVWTFSLPWVTELSWHFSLRMDALSRLFLLVISGIGFFIFWYANAYFYFVSETRRFFASLSVFTLAMMLIVVADDLFTMFVAWEVTSITSYLLISFYNEKEASRTAAKRAFLITGGGGLALLAGIIFLSMVAETNAVSEMVSLSKVIQADSLYPVILLLFLLGIMTKSALVPFHFWLPGAMAAPAPVSAYLHSATMVKAGIFLLARMHPVLGGSELWHDLVTGFGAITMLLSAGMAFFQTDLKKILAYTSVSALGTLALLLGLGTKEAVKAACTFFIVHALYKASLFLVAGVLEKKLGTRDISSLSGLARRFPSLAIVTALAAISMAGLPPWLGFIGKELLYEAKIAAQHVWWWVTPMGILANVFMVAVALKILVRPFFGKWREPPKNPGKVSFDFLLASWSLGLASLFLGLFPTRFGNSLIEPAMEVIKGESLSIQLKLWHGVNLVFLLSLLTVFLGFIVFKFEDRLTTVVAKLNPLGRVGPSRMFDLGLSSILRFAEFQTRFWQKESPRLYLKRILLFSVLVLLFSLQTDELLSLHGMNFGSVFDWAVSIFMLVSAFMVLKSTSRITAGIHLGVVGLGVSLFFLRYGAPDLAITQILVETLTVILFLAVASTLPDGHLRTPWRTRIVDWTVALSVGGLISYIALMGASQRWREPISTILGEKSLTEAYGRNVVNVVLVDFRAFDTLGEIFVLVISAVGIFAFLNLMNSLKKGSS